MDDLEPDSGSPHRLVGAGWLVRLRWAWAAGGAIFGVGASLLGAVSLGAVLLAFSLVVATNVPLAARVRSQRSQPDAVLTGALCLDTVGVTLVLAGSGGASNPMALFLLVPVMLAAMVVRTSHTWVLLALTVVEYAALFAIAPADLHHHGASEMQAHLWLMFAAYAVVGAFTAFAVARIRTALTEAARDVESAREAEVRAERLAGLATLAAGAAHELGSPLSAIFVAARELRRRLPDDGPEWRDADLICDELERCRAILDQLAADAGASRGEPTREISLDALVQQALEGAPDVAVAVEPAQVSVPVGLVTQVIRRLVGNARDAAPEAASIEVDLSEHEGALRLVVRDDARASEPFFTTKPAGEGRGLGLFFVRSVAEQLGGDLELVSAPGVGTRATVTIPVGGGST